MKKKSKLMAAVFALIQGVSTVMPGMQAQAANMDNFPVQNMSTHQKNYTAGLQTFLLNYHKNTKDIKIQKTKLHKIIYKRVLSAKDKNTKDKLYKR